MPCHPARARKLLSSGRARVHHLAPFVVRLVDREIKDSEVSGVEVGIDPGYRDLNVSIVAAWPRGACADRARTPWPTYSQKTATACGLGRVDVVETFGTVLHGLVIAPSPGFG